MGGQVTYFIYLYIFYLYIYLFCFNFFFFKKNDMGIFEKENARGSLSSVFLVLCII